MATPIHLHFICGGFHDAMEDCVVCKAENIYSQTLYRVCDPWGGWWMDRWTEGGSNQPATKPRGNVGGTGFPRLTSTVMTAAFVCVYNALPVSPPSSPQSPCMPEPAAASIPQMTHGHSERRRAHARPAGKWQNLRWASSSHLCPPLSSPHSPHGSLGPFPGHTHPGQVAEPQA